MKTKLFCLMFVWIGFQAKSFGQNEDVISNLMASEFNGKVLITWSIKQGNTCNGIQILRSTDSINFLPIGSINGICGSTLEEVPYEFTDVAPVKNSLNYYRLSLGGIGFSWIVSAEVIDVSEYNYLLRPNPISDSSELHFKNDATNAIEFTVFNSLGDKVHTELTNEAKIILQKSEYDSGIHFFILYDKIRNTKVQGRFLVP